jgi:ABC-type branched-subunit amino acid transport system substrate-binding protein
MSALANFFNVPMVVPSAIGDNLLPSNNLWAFRLSAPGSEHAAHLFNEILTRQTLAAMTTGDEFATPLRLGILYEQNTFGESTAVETAKAAMAQDVEIGYYGYFTPDTPETTRLIQAFSAMQESGVHLLYIVASNPDSAGMIVRELNKFFVPGEAPLVLGQSGGFASRQFIESPESAGVFILRQQIIPDRCPDEIETLAEAQAYAAIQLLNFAIEQSQDQLGTQQNPSILNQREAVRDSLKASSLNLPCLGLTSFDNSGHNKNLRFEFLYAASGKPRLVDEKRLLELLALRINRSPFE